MGPGGSGMGPGGPPSGKDDKEGPAEAAPKDKGALAPVVPVPAQPEGLRRLQLFELHGNLRMRADYFHRLDLGLASQPGGDTLTEFFVPPAETGEQQPDGQVFSNDVNCQAQLTARGVSIDRQSRRCPRRRGFGGANMRLRLEPTIHVTDTVKIHAQVDLLDNLSLGSTPDSFGGDNPWAPIDLLTRTQLPPNAGTNSLTDSIVVKRAWGEIRFGWGLKLEFGRMPNHWGMGILYNDGNGYERGQKDDIVRMVDTDYGDSVDSVKFSFDFGADKRNAITLGVSYDWAASGPTTAQLLGPGWGAGNRTAVPFSAEFYDNVHQFSFWIARKDDNGMLKRKLSTGEPVVNYGLKTWFRWQNIDRAIGSPGLGDGLSGNPSLDPDVDPDGLYHSGVALGNGGYNEDGLDGLQKYANSLVHRRGWILTPDLWLRVNWRTMRVEAEAAAVIGGFHRRTLGNQRTDSDFEIDTALADQRTSILQFGYALEFKYGLFGDRFHIGLDHGFASGDPSGSFNPQSPRITDGLDTRFTNFRFNPAYMQDLLLFRELLGTASNAAYFKPWMAFYFFDNNFSGRLDIEYAIAHQRIATFGQKANYGLELDAAFRYHDQQEPIFVQLQYGVMFPFGAFNRDPNAYTTAQNNGDAKAAQTIQAQIGIKF